MRAEHNASEQQRAGEIAADVAGLIDRAGTIPLLLAVAEWQQRHGMAPHKAAWTHELIARLRRGY